MVWSPRIWLEIVVIEKQLTFHPTTGLFTRRLGFLSDDWALHLTTGLAPSYWAFHPTTRLLPEYYGFSRLLGFHPNPTIQFFASITLVCPVKADAALCFKKKDEVHERLATFISGH